MDPNSYNFIILFRRLLDKLDTTALKLMETILENLISKGSGEDKYRHIKGRKLPDASIDVLLALHFQKHTHMFGNPTSNYLIKLTSLSRAALQLLART